MSAPAAGGSGSHISAMKLIPKGFKVAGEITITANNETAWVAGAPAWCQGGGALPNAQIDIFSQVVTSIAAPAILIAGPLPLNVGWNVPSGTWTGGLTLTAFGDGTVVIIPQITIATGQQITIGDALVSITVSMSRG